MSNPAVDLASTIQSASFKHHPDPAHDLNPSAAASQKRPVSPTTSVSSEASIPYSALKPVPRRPNLPPLPDLRFEQSYLASLNGAETWWTVAWITGRDQVLLPLVQGTLWTLALSGWRYWNRGAAFSGQTLGVKLRRWWWGVNNWKIPEEYGAKNTRLADNVGEVSTWD